MTTELPDTTRPDTVSPDTSLPDTASPETLDPDKQQYLRYLAVGHYVMAGLAFLFGSIPLIHFVLGLVFAFQGATAGGGFTDETFIGLTFGLFFAFVGLVLVLSAWAYGVFLVKAARALQERRHYMLCMVMAAISCVFAPVGTVLGVFTLLLLLDDEVKTAFGR